MSKDLFFFLTTFLKPRKQEQNHDLKLYQTKKHTKRNNYGVQRQLTELEKPFINYISENIYNNIQSI